MERRHLSLSSHRTTISLEPDYWEAIEALSGGQWRQWATDRLTIKPESTGRSSWLRQQVLAGYMRNAGFRTP